jgi:hypothetical protein
VRGHIVLEDYFALVIKKPYKIAHHCYPVQSNVATPATD